MHRQAFSVVRVVEFWMETALLVCLNSASVALVIAASASDTRSGKGEHLGMFGEGRDDLFYTKEDYQLFKDKPLPTGALISRSGAHNQTPESS